MKRSDRRNKKRKKLCNVLVIISLALLMIIGYWVYQYMSGLSEASDGLYKEDGTTFDAFEGPDPQIGEINVLLIGSDARSDCAL